MLHAGVVGDRKRDDIYGSELARGEEVAGTSVGMQRWTLRWFVGGRSREYMRAPAT